MKYFEVVLQALGLWAIVGAYETLVYVFIVR